MKARKTIRLAKKRHSIDISTRSDLARVLDVDARGISRVLEDPPSYYGIMRFPKPDGRIREIRPPRRILRGMQRNLLEFLYCRLRIPTFLHGGIPKRSIVTHATPHVGREMVATLDVRDFFPSTTPAHIEPVLEQAGLAREALSDVVRMTSLDGGLPQGSPTSCLLANLAFFAVDLRIRRLCRTRGLTYSRYVDDIAVSGESDFHELKGPFLEIIAHGRYVAAAEKTKFQDASVPQVITGLVANDKLRPTGEFIRRLNGDIRLCLEHTAAVVALAEGLTVRALKAKLNGRVAHIRACDERRGTKLRRRLNGVDWSPIDMMKSA